MSDKQSPFILVDGSSYLFRAFHGMPPMSNSKGQETHAIYGVVNMLKSLLKTYEPTHIAVVFDAKGKTFRDDIYPEYKANRPPMPDELRSQIEPLHKIIQAMGLPLIIEPNVEADDVIGTLTKRATALGMKSLVSTGDKDMAQLVDDHVTLINTMTNTLMDVSGVHEKFGVGPELIIDYLALKGDKVDNIPGVPGVGDKTAVGLLNGIGGIDAIYANLDKIATLAFRGAKTMAKKMVEHEANARLSYELATIAVDLALDVSPDMLRITPEDKDTLASLYQEYEFKRWYAEASGEAFTPKVTPKSDTETTAPTPVNGDKEAVLPDLPPIDRAAYQVVYTEAQLLEWLKNVSQPRYLRLILKRPVWPTWKRNWWGSLWRLRQVKRATFLSGTIIQMHQSNWIATLYWTHSNHYWKTANPRKSGTTSNTIKMYWPIMTFIYMGLPLIRCSNHMC